MSEGHLVKLLRCMLGFQKVVRLLPPFQIHFGKYLFPFLKLFIYLFIRVAKWGDFEFAWSSRFLSIRPNDYFILGESYFLINLWERYSYWKCKLGGTFQTYICLKICLFRFIFEMKAVQVQVYCVGSNGICLDFVYGTKVDLCDEQNLQKHLKH